MGLFTFLQSTDINEGLKDYEATPNATLLDVRTPEEYQEGHIPNSKNVPLQTIETVSTLIKDKETPIFVYCLSGGRSKQAATIIKKLGYQQVTNIGGISTYRGKVEK